VKVLINKIVELSEQYNKQIADYAHLYNHATTESDKIAYITDIINVFDNLVPLVSFIIHNQENIEAIINKHNDALDKYKQLTGKDYETTMIGNIEET